MSPKHKPIAWLHGEVKTPPFSAEARIEAGYLPRKLQQGDKIGMPHSRPMPSIGPRCHELRVNDKTANWRLVYRIDDDAIVFARGVQQENWQNTQTNYCPVQETIEGI